MPSQAAILLRIILAGLIAAVICVEPLGAAGPPALDQRELAKLSGLFRRHRARPKQRAEAVEQLTAAGAEGIAAAKDLIDKEHHRLAASIRGLSPSTPQDEQIEQLRTLLAKLRADPELTKEKLQKIGFPALSRLTVLCQQRQSQLFRQRGKLAKARQQLGQFAEFLQLLAAQWKETAPPLPLKDYQQQIGQLLEKIVDRRAERAQQIMAENTKLAGRLDPAAVQGMRGLNQLRVVCGLEPLAFDPKLCQAAIGHSTDMRQHKFFAHESPLPGKRTFQDRARLAGTTASGENIYTGGVSATSAGKAWFLSPGHHKNMLSETHRRQGLGRSGNYWTHVFGR